MSVVVLCSATGAPGVTTTTLAVGWVWPLVVPGRRAVVVDADVAGSGVLPGYLQAGVPAGGGVLGLAGERGVLSVDLLLEQALALDPGEQRLVLTGVTDPAQARALGPVWRGLLDAAGHLDATGIDLLVDVGRLGHRHEPTAMLEHADTVAVVTRSNLAALTGATAGLQRLRDLRDPGLETTAVLVGEGQPYPARQIGRELDADPLPVMALDPWAAGALATGGALGWRFDRSALLRTARTLAVILSAGHPALSTGVRR